MKKHNPKSRLQSRPIASSFFDRRDDTAITWLGMAGIMINTRGTIILIDPLLTSVHRTRTVQDAETGHHLCFPWPIKARKIPRAEAVLYTHTDADHFGRATAAALNAAVEPRFLGPRPVLAWLEEMGIGLNRLREVHESETIRIGQAKIVVTPALHDYATDYPFKRGDCCGYLVGTPDGNIWIPGDSRLIDEQLAVKDVDVLFFDVAVADAHLGPAGSAALARSSGAKLLVAYHYGTFEAPPGDWANCDPLAARRHLAGIPARYIMPSPGQIITLPLNPDK